MANKHYLRRFDSVGALVRFLDSEPVSAFYRGRALSSQTLDSSFTGTKNWAEAYDLLRFGDPASAALLQSAAVKLRVADGSRRAFVDSVAGFAPNVPAYLRGLPLSMISKGTKTANNKVVDLVYNMAAHYQIDASDIVAAGAKVLTAIQAAEKNGYRVNLYAASVAESDTDGYGRRKKSVSSKEIAGLFVKIKDSGTYITPAKIAFFLVNPAFLRRVAFAYRERLPVTRSNWRCYGFPVNDPARVASYASEAGAASSASVTLCFNDVRYMTVQQIADRLTGAAK